MSRVTPIDDRNGHALDQVVFSVIFEEKFSDSVFEHSRDFAEQVAEDLPDAADVDSVQVKITEEGAIAQVKRGGVLLKSVSSEGSADPHGWVVDLSENSIDVVCRNYQGWSEVLEKALGYCITAVEFVEQLQPECLVVEIRVLFGDKFLMESATEEYSIDDVFSDQTNFISEHIRGSGAIWHLHSGWIEKSESKTWIMNLNIGCTRKDDSLPHVTQVDHVSRFVFDKSTSLDYSLVHGVFSSAHDRNKELLNELLSSSMIGQIKLNH